MAKTVKVQEAKTRLSAILAEVEHGAEVVIARGDTPVARLTAIAEVPDRDWGFVPYDVPSSFLEPLPEDEVAAWEIATKQRLGKLPQAEVLVRGYQQHLDRLDVETIDIGSAHTLLAGSMACPHRDLFDRMIAAQCMIDSLPLVTSDEAFQTLNGVRVLW